MEHCPNCGGDLKIIAAILEQPVIEKILTHLGLQARSGGVQQSVLTSRGRGQRLHPHRPPLSNFFTPHFAGSDVRLIALIFPVMARNLRWLHAATTVLKEFSMRCLGTLILAACAAFVATPAMAGIINFEDLGVVAGTQLNTSAGVSQNTGGFTVTPGPINTSGLNDLHFHNQDGVGNNGSTILGTHDDVVFTKIGGGVFSVFSFDFEGFITEAGLTVVGALSGGGTVSQTITPDFDPATYQTFTLAGFQNLTSVSFNYLGNGASGFFLDNINTGAEVPEPGALGLVALALIALALARRKAQ